MKRSVVINGVLFGVLVALAAGSRFLEIAPNFAAVAAAGLFAGAFFRSRILAGAVPIGALVVSDLFLPSYPWYQMAAVYGSMALSVVLGAWVGDSRRTWRIAGAAAAGSVVFFVVTNFAVWAGGMYGWTWSGLARCYLAAVPFFKYTLAGDLFYSAMLFGAAGAVKRAAGWRAPSVEACGAG
jgi:hypothetical protein